MSGASSSTSHALRRITWALKNSAKDIEGLGYLKNVESVVHGVPELSKVTKGEIHGGLHLKKAPDGTIADPEHISGVLGTGNLKRSNKITSFHYYPDTGLVQFSNKKYGSYYVGDRQDETRWAAAQQARHIPSHQKATDWVWDEEAKAYRYWDGKQWVWQAGADDNGESSSRA